MAEIEAFGVPAPTSSTTTALALLDALAIAVARRQHAEPMAVFRRHHPGGAIGNSVAQTDPRTMGQIAVQLDEVPTVEPQPIPGLSTSLDILLTAVKSTFGWVRPSPETIISPRQIQRLGRTDLSTAIVALGNDFLVARPDWISVPSTSTVEETREWILQMRQSERGKTFLKKETILGIVDSVRIVSKVVEIEDVVGDEEL